MDSPSKRCFKCLQVLPLEAFYKHSAMSDKRLNKCKECTKADVKKHRLENIEHYRSYDRMRSSQPHRVAKRLQIFEDYKKAFPNRVKATNAVNNAVRDGRLQKWPCQVCGNPKSVAHHADYDNPLGVVWLCQAHHKQAHALVANDEGKEAA